MIPCALYSLNHLFVLSLSLSLSLSRLAMPLLCVYIQHALLHSCRALPHRLGARALPKSSNAEIAIARGCAHANATCSLVLNVHRGAKSCAMAALSTHALVPKTKSWCIGRRS